MTRLVQGILRLRLRLRLLRLPLPLALTLLWPNISVAREQAIGHRVLIPDDAGNLHTTHGMLADFAPGGVEHRVVVTSEILGHGDSAVVHYYVEHVVTTDGQTQARRTQEWRDTEKYPTTFDILATRVTSSGQCLALALRTQGSDDARRTDVVLLEEGRFKEVLAENLSISDVRMILDAQDRPIVFFRTWSTIRQLRDGRGLAVRRHTNHDWSVAQDSRGEVYIISYDYRARSLWASVSNGEMQRWTHTMIDGPESGWQHSIAIHQGELFVFYYYYRNAFNKGLNLAILKDGHLVSKANHLRERDFNAGWFPLMGIRTNGAVEISYAADALDDALKTETFSSTTALVQRARPEALGTWDDRYQDLFIRCSIMPSFQFWKIGAPMPSADEAATRIRASYDYDPSVVMTVSGEARWGSTHFGLSYAHSVISREIERVAGRVTAKAFNGLSGYVGIADLLLGHDVLLSATYADFEGQYHDENGARSANTGIREIELGLLNQWRMRYGLRYRRYGLIQPVYAYFAPPEVKQYSFVGATVVDSTVHRAEIFGGYSRLDYMSKYETSYAGFDVDAFVAAGFGVSTFDEVDIGGHRTNHSVELAFRANVKLGVAYYHRFYGLRGAGIFVRGGYEASYLMNGFAPGQPEDREDESDSDRDELKNESLVVYAAHHQLLHGPYVGLGVVW
ncbi:MAG: hypothetical protein IPK13_28055 [Deltaproteobacteria bacterium]|nr:hypothetical protein [Deltaproteobacteria bacterium]